MDDRDIVARIKAELGITEDGEEEDREEYDEDGRLILLNLSGLGITYIPVELGQLTNLQSLTLYNNQLTQLPMELGQLTNLQDLWLSYNHLTQLPVELGHLTYLRDLWLYDNPDLLTPPPEIASQETQEILTFLRELQRASITRYEAKLLLVGEGGTGKSSLLRALRGQDFEKNLDTTHGIAVENLPLPHPHLPNQPLTLNAWDFGLSLRLCPSGDYELVHCTHASLHAKPALARWGDPEL